MKKKRLLWMSMLLLILAGCSSDDEITDKDLVGYWKDISDNQTEIKDNTAKVDYALRMMVRSLYGE